MVTPFPDGKISMENNLLTLAGHGGPFDGKPGAIKFKSLLRAQNEGGSVTAGVNTLTITKADAVTLHIACGTSFVNYKDVSADANARAAHDLDAASAKNYAQLLARHLEDYQSLFRRV